MVIRFQKLYDFLMKYNGESISFTLDALNELLKDKLPNCARKYPQPNFANGPGNGYSYSWMAAGFRAKYVKAEDTVIFYRVGSACEAEMASRSRKSPKVVARDDCIVLNKSFTGEWLNKADTNVAHEIINFFKADDGQVYIYNTPYGANVSNSKNLDIKYLYLTTPASNGVYFLEYCIEISKSLHHITIGRGEEKEKVRAKIREGINQIRKELGKPYTEVKYGEIRVDQLFEDTIDVLPFTYLAKKVWKATLPIAIDENAIPSETNGNKNYEFARNFGYVLKSENPNTFDELLSKGPDRNPQAWVEQTLPTFKKLDPRKPRNAKILGALNQDTFIDLVDNFKMEECYTKILSKLMESNPTFINKILKEVVNIQTNETFEPTDELVIKGYGRIDIFAKSNSYALILENKIDSTLTVTKGVSQLKNYYDWANTNEEVINLTKIYILLAPDYRINAVKSEEVHFRSKEGFAPYIIVPYSKIYKIYEDLKSKNKFNNFKYQRYLDDIDSLLLRMSLERKELYTAKISKRILSTNRR